MNPPRKSCDWMHRSGYPPNPLALSKIILGNLFIEEARS